MEEIFSTVTSPLKFPRVSVVLISHFTCYVCTEYNIDSLLCGFGGEKGGIYIVCELKPTIEKYTSFENLKFTEGYIMDGT